MESLISTASILIKLSCWALKHIFCQKTRTGSILGDLAPFSGIALGKRITEFSSLPVVCLCEQVWASSAFYFIQTKHIVDVLLDYFFLWNTISFEKATTKIILSTTIMLKINNCRVWVIIVLILLQITIDILGRMFGILIFMFIRSMEFPEWISLAVFYLLDICIHTTPVIQFTAAT